MEIFYFALMTYNQEDMVKETLESFKYQIDRYGEGRSFKLIVVDDASQDGTVCVIERWLRNNNGLFFDVDMNLNKTNCGVVRNYQLILGKIPASCHFKILAGDDVLSSHNIFLSYQKLDNVTLVTHVKLLLKDGVVYYDNDQLLAFYDHSLNSCSKKDMLKRMRRGGYLHTPSTIYTKKLYEFARCSDLNSRFCLFEDDPSWYSMIKNIDELNIEFLKKPIVLYRISDSAISNGNGVVNKRFLEELKLLIKIYYRDSSGFEKLYHWARLNDKLPKLLRYNVYINFIKRRYLRMKYGREYEYLNFRREIDEIVKNEQIYYDTFIKDSKIR